ncbi:MAG: 3-hydroxyacyl-CoA dehydrogenase family protein [Gemmatimonadaceae bacterium]
MSVIAVIGAGTMGRRLTFDFARAGHAVSLFDVAPAVGADAMRWLTRTLQLWEQEGRLTAGAAESALKAVTLRSSLADAVASADFILENVPERLALKRALFAELGSMLGDDAIIVSNTSSLPGSLMADASGRGDRFINANFSHLGHPKVEIMPHSGTSETTRTRVITLLRETGFAPLVLRHEQFGYASNRVWRAVKKEVLRQIDAGIISPQDLDRGWMHDWEVPLGPCALMDAIGLDVVRDIEQSYADYSGDPTDSPPPFLEKMVAEGSVGRKSGKGFYSYPNPEFEDPRFLTGT